MSEVRHIEVDKNALLVIPSTDTRSIDQKAGSIVIIYPPEWTPEAVAQLVAAAKGGAV